MGKIMYTRTDEAPLLATYSFLPIVEAFCAPAGVEFELRDISLPARILALFPEKLSADQQVENALASLGELAKTPEANIIKLPNISASMPQLNAAIAELQAKGYDVPDYPENPTTDEERSIKTRYDAVKGSAVNPVLREGNSDRRAPKAVKEYAKKHPHSMGAWSKDSKTNVMSMTGHDFRANEQSYVSPAEGSLTVKFVDAAGAETVLKAIPVLEGEIVDATVLEAAALDSFLAEAIARAKAEDVLFSVHLKATMMKVSDPIIFGHVVRAFLPQTFEKYGDVLREAGLTGNNGLGAILAGLDALPQGAEIKASIDEELANGPRLAMVNSDKGITNLHVPSDVIIDASMPAMIRNSGKMWGADGQAYDTLAVIPDSSYSGIYEAMIDECREKGAFDPSTMGTVPNVGLMAQKAEEYGSHDKTFEMTGDGRVDVVDNEGNVVMTHQVHAGDIWRGCQAKDAPIRDWVKLAVTRSRLSGMPVIFWLDPERAHDRNIRAKVDAYLPEFDTTGLDISFATPTEAARTSAQRMRDGLDTISATGNVLRDYNTDLFPILEVGTSAKMLSVVPLMNGGGLFETGAGGSAPKHVQQLVEENYLRWDSLGEFLALSESLQQFARVENDPKAKVVADALDTATGRMLDDEKSPSRSIGGIDNRGSHFWEALYWAEELAAQTEDADLAATFKPIAEELRANAEKIDAELKAVQGKPADIGGYYVLDDAKTTAVMRPSQTLNDIIAKLG